MKNWRTTLAGLLLATGAMMPQPRAAGDFDWRKVVMAVGAALTGYAGADAKRTEVEDQKTNDRIDAKS